MMTQGELAFKFEEERQGEGITGMTGIGPCLDLACTSGLIFVANKTSILLKRYEKASKLPERASQGMRELTF